MPTGSAIQGVRQQGDLKAAEGAPIVSVIIPTFNEKENVARIRAAVGDALRNYRHEIVFVDDDSSDGTLDELRELARTDKSVRFLQRIGRRGLSLAVVEGILSTSSPLIAVIDATSSTTNVSCPKCSTWPWLVMRR